MAMARPMRPSTTVTRTLRMQETSPRGRRLGSGSNRTRLIPRIPARHRRNNTQLKLVDLGSADNAGPFSFVFILGHPQRLKPKPLCRMRHGWKPCPFKARFRTPFSNRPLVTPLSRRASKKHKTWRSKASACSVPKVFRSAWGLFVVKEVISPYIRERHNENANTNILCCCVRHHLAGRPIDGEPVGIWRYAHHRRGHLGSAQGSRAGAGSAPTSCGAGSELH